MLIRTQNKFELMELSNITLSIERSTLYKDTPCAIVALNESIGYYSSVEKAFKVLDMIEEKYNEPTYINDLGGGEFAKYERKVFHMPEDGEVIV